MPCERRVTIVLPDKRHAYIRTGVRMSYAARRDIARDERLASHHVRVAMTAPVQPPLSLPVAPPAVAAISPARYRELARRVRLLSWLSLGAMSAEGVVAIVAGVMAGSIALVGFGLDSAVEGFASVIIIWRFTGSRVMSERAEQRAQKLVAIQFFVLAPYVAFESLRALAGGEHPDVSVLGMVLAVFSLVTMPLLGIAKQRIAEEIGSAATKGEGRQNVLCAYLAGALLIGLAGNAIAGAWWLDPVVGLLIAAVAVKEGLDAWRGDGCCVASPLDTFAIGGETCQDDCCR
jgi:Cation efflux family